MMRRLACQVLICLATPLAAQTDRPLSAIDWLSQSVTEPPVPVAAPPTNPPPRPRLDEPPVADSARTPDIVVTPLDGPATAPIGTLPQAETGLPVDMWAASDPDRLVTLIAAQPEPALPALRDLLRMLLLARADAPPGAEESLLLARVDKLLDLAALDDAQALIDAADPTDPELFRRWFDISLLTGVEDEACAAMQTAPGIAPTFPARIFCLARSGDWMAAALTLNTHRALDDVSATEDALLSRFLDADLVDPAQPLPPPDRVSPLIFRMREAIGEGLATRPLPLAFARADLRDTVGEKARLEAMERLSLHCALPTGALEAAMRDVTPAASGGVWDRLASLQDLSAALAGNDVAAVQTTLPAAWGAARTIHAEIDFAEIFGAALSGLPLTGAAGDIARTVGLLTGNAATLADLPEVPTDLPTGLATGRMSDLQPHTAMEEAVLAGLNDTGLPEPTQALLADGKLGEALLTALAVFDAGVAGDARSVTDALRILRAAGLGAAARRAALELLLLDRES